MGWVDSGQETSKAGCSQPPTFQERGLFSAKINHNIAYNVVICVTSIKRKYSRVQIKKIPRIGGTKYAFIHGSRDSMVANNSNHISRPRMILKNIQRFCRSVWF
jgi:hypothetical protein